MNTIETQIEVIDMDNPPPMDWITPVERIHGLQFKREDKWVVEGCAGAKARAAWAIATMKPRPPGLVTVGNRLSPQPAIVARIAKRLNLPCRIHTAWGSTTPEIQVAIDAGAEIITVNPGYNPVLVRRAEADVKESGWRLIPFGMNHRISVDLTAHQAQHLPEGINRIVVAVGSAICLSGILTGLHQAGRSIPILGVSVGKQGKVRRVLDQYVPREARRHLEIVQSALEYHERPKKTSVYGIELDPIYESKCIPYLRTGDLFWIVGIRP
jgi:1-aminocyclopropane-1-carboxylate deaminase/D-cysteine desulfhydrase-like pyridoxal-dependent ACC family enzyme